MPSRFENVAIWKTRGKYRDETWNNKVLYNQRNKDENIVSVIKVSWRTYDIQTNTNTESGTNFQMYNI